MVIHALYSYKLHNWAVEIESIVVNIFFIITFKIKTR